jgi:protein-tyrosine phosphatase
MRSTGEKLIREPGMIVLSAFPISWVLVGDLALGPAPVAARHLNKLEAEGITAVFSLCSTEEKPTAVGMEERFHCQRLVLPDHRSRTSLTLEQLEHALEILAALRNHGPVFVHCVAALERSPLVCLAWLMRQHGLSRQNALDYLLQVHPGTSPSAAHLMLLAQLGHVADGALKIA